MVISERQLEILSLWQNEDSNVLINAVAGSGKTTTLLELLRICQYRTLFLAFNKSIQEEIQSKIDERGLAQGKALTMHSLGLSSIRAGYRKVVINNGKNWDLLKQLQAENKAIFKKIQWKEKIKLSYCLMDMNDVSRMFLIDTVDEIKERFASMDKIMVDEPNLPILWEKFLELRAATYEGDVINIDFNDMIYIPVLKDLNIPVRPYYLMIDEAQDLNLCQHKLINNLLGQGDIQRWIAVGDRNQAIYGFSGASASSFDLLKAKENVVELPLDICYRCSQTIIDSANEVFDVMEYGRREVGYVGTIGDASSIKDNSMVICRNSGPLITMYFQLLALDRSCYIKGEDILNSIVRFVKPYNKLTTSAALTEMRYKMEDLSADTSDEGKIKLYVFKEDFTNFVRLTDHISEQFQTVDSFINKVKSLFIDKEDAIMLCTIHKSKGLEADVVYIVNEHLIPSKFAKSTEQLIQEQNLKYVARTRAKNELYFLNI